MDKINFNEMTDEELVKAAEKARRALTGLHIQRRRGHGNMEELKTCIFKAQEVLGVIDWHLTMRKIVSHRHSSSRKCIPV